MNDSVGWLTTFKQNIQNILHCHWFFILSTDYLVTRNRNLFEKNMLTIRSRCQCCVCPNAHANISTKIPNKNVFNSVSVAQVIQNSFPWQYCPFSLPISISIWAESALFNSRWLLLIPLMRQHMLIIFVFSNSLFILCCVWRRVDRRIQIACR